MNKIVRLEKRKNIFRLKKKVFEEGGWKVPREKGQIHQLEDKTQIVSSHAKVPLIIRSEKIEVGLGRLRDY